MMSFDNSQIQLDMILSYATAKEKIPFIFSYCVQRTDIDSAFSADADIGLSVAFVQFYEWSNKLDPKFWKADVRGRCPFLSLRYSIPRWPPYARSREEPIKVVSVGRGAVSRAHNEQRAKNRPFSRWQLEIYAVPKFLKQQIHEECVSQHLPALNRWLAEAHSDSWLLTNHQKTCVFDPSSQTSSMVDGNDF